MKGAGSALTDVLNPHRAECGKLRAEFGEWRVELKALVCLPCKGGGPQSGGGVLIKRVESGE